MLSRRLHHLLFACATILVLIGVALSAGGLVPPEAFAQTELNQSYDCGSYGAGDFGQQDCVMTTVATPTPNPPATDSEDEANGDMPGTGASLGLWAAIGALSLGTGLGLYGYSRRAARRRD